MEHTCVTVGEERETWRTENDTLRDAALHNTVAALKSDLQERDTEIRALREQLDAQQRTTPQPPSKECRALYSSLPFMGRYTGRTVSAHIAVTTPRAQPGENITHRLTKQAVTMNHVYASVSRAVLRELGTTYCPLQQSEVTLQYTDEDGDLITVGSEAEWAECLRQWERGAKAKVSEEVAASDALGTRIPLPVVAVVTREELCAPLRARMSARKAALRTPEPAENVENVANVSVAKGKKGGSGSGGPTLHPVREVREKRTPSVMSLFNKKIAKILKKPKSGPPLPI